jgi:hypothetical protein
MLRRLAGDERFFAAMRDFVTENRYRAASWTELRNAFERRAAADLGWFFRQWVEGAATAELDLRDVSAGAAAGGYELRFAVTQKPPALALAVPLTIYFERGPSETRVVPVSRERSEFRHSLERKPVRVVLDESYDIFRRLAPSEVPPMIATLLARPQVTLIGTPAEQAKFSSLVDAFEREGVSIAHESAHREWVRREPPASAAAQPSGALPPRPIARSTDSTATIASLPGSLILLGEHGPLIRALFGGVDLPQGGFGVTVLRHPRSSGDMVAILNATSKAEVDAAYETLIRRPRYSSAAFDGGKMISYELQSGARGLSREVEGRR